MSLSAVLILFGSCAAIFVSCIYGGAFFGLFGLTAQRLTQAPLVFLTLIGCHVFNIPIYNPEQEDTEAKVEGRVKDEINENDTKRRRWWIGVYDKGQTPIEWLNEKANVQRISEPPMTDEIKLGRPRPSHEEWKAQRQAERV